MSEWVKVTASDGFELSAYVARPQGEPLGAIVVIQEIFGVNKSIQAVADSYAKDGFLAVAPAIMDRIERGLNLGYGEADLKKAFSLYPKLNPDDGRVDWKLPAHVVDRQIRACTPDPGAWTELDGLRLKLGPVSLDTRDQPGADPADPADPAAAPDLAPGELRAGRHAVLVGTGSHPVRLGDVQAPGKRRMTASDWARGLRSGGPVRFG